MIKTLITEFPITDVPVERSISKEKIKKYTYSKAEVDVLIDAAVERAVAEARKIDEESMAKHNRDATVISMILRIYYTLHCCRWVLDVVYTTFMEIDINILDR